MSPLGASGAWWARAVVVIAAMACGACPGADGRSDAGVDDAGVNDFGCPPPKAGLLPLEGVEAQGGFDALLSSLDLAVLPETLPTAGIDPVSLDLITWMLEEPQLPEPLRRDDVLGRGLLGRAVAGAFAIRGEDGGFDVSFARRGLQRFYACDRDIPPTLQAFRDRVFDFDGAAGELVQSNVKGLRRRISRDVVTGSFVAETLLDDDTVRETEIILTEARSDGTLEFFEYDAAGDLGGASVFRSNGRDVGGPVPFACIQCHGFTDVSPAGF